MPKKIEIIQVAAASHDDAIGINEKLPWKCKGDSAFFKQIVVNEVCIIGRKSYAEIRMSGFTNTKFIVCSTNAERVIKTHIKYPKYTAPSLHAALLLAASLASKPSFIIAGGSSIYSQSLIFTDKMLISRIPGVFEYATHYLPLDYKQYFRKVEEAQMDGFVLETWVKRRLRGWSFTIYPKRTKVNSKGGQCDGRHVQPRYAK